MNNRMSALTIPIVWMLGSPGVAHAETTPVTMHAADVPAAPTTRLALFSSADGQSFESASSPASTGHPPRYGLQIATVDLVSWIFLLSGVAADTPGVAIVGSVGLTLSGPTIHAVHKNPNAAVKSLGLRTLAPAGVALAAGFIAEQGSDNGEGLGVLPAVAIAGGVTLIAGQLYDALVLSRPARKPASTTAATSHPSWTPAVSVAPRGGATLSIAGVW